LKVLLYSEGKNLFSKSGVGRALKHQMEALALSSVEFTTDERDTYDIVHINTIGTGAVKLIKKCKKKSIPIIYNTHTTYEDFKDSFMFSNLIAPFIKRRIKKLYSSADYIISPSKYTLGIVKSYGIDLDGEVISNGVSNDEFVKNSEYADKFKEEYKIDKPLVICVGLPFRRKGILDFCKIAEQMPEVQFIWFGANISTIVTSDVRKKIKNPPSNVKFPGYVSNETIIGAYSLADLFFFPTYEENEGIVVLESLSIKCPILLRDIPVYKGWLEDEKECLKGKNNEEFIEKIKKVINNKEIAKNITELGKIKAKERDLKIIGEKLKNVYKKVIDIKK
jgi:1,2-diacylglycerol-3-alpha-glucose alpha-1,2-glucosyltransferase